MNRNMFLIAVLALIPLSTLAAKPHAPGTLILAMVVEVSQLDDIKASGEDGMLGMLYANGITDDEISDGSIAFGIVYCCGGKVSRDTAYGFYIPTDFRVAVGDVVEVSMGRTVSKKERRRGDRGAVNRATRVRFSFNEDDGSCIWDPEDDRMWMRVLRCDWMQDEGWQYRGGLSEGWYKLPAVTLDEL